MGRGAGGGVVELSRKFLNLGRHNKMLLRVKNFKKCNMTPPSPPLQLSTEEYSVYTSVMFHLYFLTSAEMKYTSCILLCLKRNTLI